MSGSVPIAAGYLAIQAMAYGNTAVSHEADTLRDSATGVIESVERSLSLFGRKSALISDVLVLADECSEDGWDGYDGAKVDMLAVAHAVAFIRALPEGVTLPEAVPEPDGSVGMEWFVSPYRTFSASLGLGDRIPYAWLDGTDKGHAVARFDGVTVPRRILDGIHDITASTQPTLGPA